MEVRLAEITDTGHSDEGPGALEEDGSQEYHTHSHGKRNPKKQQVTLAGGVSGGFSEEVTSESALKGK